MSKTEYTSPQKISDRPISDFPDGFFQYACSCGIFSTLHVAKYLPSKKTVAQAIDDVRCEVCKTNPQTVYLSDAPSRLSTTSTYHEMIRR